MCEELKEQLDTVNEEFIEYRGIIKRDKCGLCQRIGRNFKRNGETILRALEEALSNGNPIRSHEGRVRLT